MNTNIFEQASREGLLFPSVVGKLTVFDLWQLPIRTTNDRKASLENVGNGLLKAQEKAGTTSILGPATQSPAQRTLELQLAIVRRIIEVRTAENKAKTEAAAKKSQRAKLDAIIETRKAAETPLEQLIAERDALS